MKYKEKFDWDKYLMGEDRFAREIKRLEVKKGDLVVLESTVYNDPKQPSIRYISKKFNVEQLEYQLEPIIQFDETSASSLFRRNGDLYVINASYDLCTSEELADLSNHWFESIKKK